MDSRMDPDLDDRLRALFKRLGQAEGARVPPLARVLERTPGRPRLTPTWALVRRAALVASVFALAAVGLWRLTPTHAPVPPRSSADLHLDLDLALLHWTSPTAALLTGQEHYVAGTAGPSGPAAGRGTGE